MRQEFIKFLRVLLDENLDLKEHIKYIEKKIAESLRLLKEARPIVEQNALLALYNYANIAWESAHKKNLKKVSSQQKYVIRSF